MARFAHIAGKDGYQHFNVSSSGARVIGQSNRYVSIRVIDENGSYIWGSASSWSTWNPSSHSADDPADDLTKTAIPGNSTIEIRTDDDGAENSWISLQYEDGMRYAHVAPGGYFTAPAGGAKIIGRSATVPSVRLEDGKNPGTYIWGSASDYDSWSTVADRPSSSLAEVAIPGGSTLRISGTSNTWLSIAY